MTLVISIILLQTIAIYLDNHSIFRLISNHKKNNIAQQLAKRGQIEFFCRGFLFFSPPLLGILLMNKNMFLLLLVFFICAFISLMLTLLQSYNFLSSNQISLKINLAFLNNKKAYFFFFFGIFVYFIYLFIPFFLNIIGLIYNQHSVWIVQLSPALTTFSTIFVVFYMDPKLATHLDMKTNIFNVAYEIIFIRLVGRFLLFLFAGLILFLR